MDDKDSIDVRLDDAGSSSDLARLEELETDTNESVREMLLWNPNLPRHILEKLVGRDSVDPHEAKWKVARYLASKEWGDYETLMKLPSEYLWALEDES